MVPDFSKFFDKISLSRHDSTEPRLSCGSWGQKPYVHIAERHGCPTLGGPALIFQIFHFWSLIALNSVHLLTIQWVQTNQLVKPVRIIPCPKLNSKWQASPVVGYSQHRCEWWIFQTLLLCRFCIFNSSVVFSGFKSRCKKWKSIIVGIIWWSLLQQRDPQNINKIC